METRDYWYWLGTLEELGAAAAGRLISLYESPENIFKEAQLPLGEKQQAALEQSRKRIGELLRERDRYEEEGIHWCCLPDEEYPGRLLNIPDPPPVLFWKGKLPPEGGKTAAVIGARRCSAYGKSLAERFGRELAKENIPVISGMAMGVDGCAQEAAADAGGGSYAVLGCGVDQVYPKVNRRLYEKLQENGGVLSEYKPGTPPLAYHFPLRNRIISGLCDVLLVIEARLVSGTLITVDQALEQGRDVLAVPGRLGDPLSEGCNRLIRQGAGILTGISDVLETLGLADPAGDAQAKAERERNRKVSALTAEQKKLLRALSYDPQHLEELMIKTGFGLGEVSLLLLFLEEEGLVRPVSGGQYVRT